MGARTFRAGVVTVVERSDGQVLAFERVDTPGAWQLPQGGIDEGEQPVEAAWRELKEETGLRRKHVELVGEHDDWLVYTWPPEIANGRRLGQAQRWFRFRLLDDATEPKPDGREFGAWRWVDRQWLIDNVIEFRRRTYRRGLARGCGCGDGGHGG